VRSQFRLNEVGPPAVPFGLPEFIEPLCIRAELMPTVP